MEVAKNAMLWYSKRNRQKRVGQFLKIFRVALGKEKKANTGLKFDSFTGISLTI
jgi:hypothetical protein